VFFDPIEGDVGLQMKKTGPCVHSEVDECLYKWFPQKYSENVPRDGIVLKVQAVQFNKLLCRDVIFTFNLGTL
jgi:hypothetical protein